LSSQITALEERVQLVQNENDAAIVAKKSSYEKKLETQHKENNVLLKQNQRLKKEIQQLEITTGKLEKRAQKLDTENDGLRNETVSLQEKLATLQEFSENLLSHYDTSNATELAVLHELATVRAMKKSHFDHEQRLSQIGAQKTLSLLEVSAGRRSLQVPAGAGASQLVTLLESNLGALAEEHASRLSSLKQEFKTRFEAGLAEHDRLSSEQKQLDAKRGSLEKLRERLEAAVSTLSDAQRDLHEGVVSLRAFMTRAGKGETGTTAAPAKESTSGKIDEVHPHSDSSWVAKVIASATGLFRR
jgi:chromosome segregation ATPase